MPACNGSTIKLMKFTYKIGTNPTATGVPTVQQMLDVRGGEQLRNMLRGEFLRPEHSVSFRKPLK